MNTPLKYFLKIFPPHFETTSSLEPPKLIDYEVSDDWKDNVINIRKLCMVKCTFLEIFDEDQHTVLEYYLMGIFFDISVQMLLFNVLLKIKSKGGRLLSFQILPPEETGQLHLPLDGML